MGIKCPYTRTDLAIAKISACRKIEACLEVSPDLNAKLEEIVQMTDVDSKEKMAAFHQISVKDLIDSPNYGILKDEYHLHCVASTMRAMKEVLGFNEEEAWSVLI